MSNAHHLAPDRMGQEAKLLWESSLLDSMVVCYQLFFFLGIAGAHDQK
jgi:hypothetical protein